MTQRSWLLLCLLVVLTACVVTYRFAFANESDEVNTVELRTVAQPIPVAPAVMLPPEVPVAVAPKPVAPKPVAPKRKLKSWQSMYDGYVGHWRTVRATAYAPDDPCSKVIPDWTTSTGVDCHEEPYGIAVPYRNGKPLFVPYGTKIIVPPDTKYVSKTRSSDRIFVADDTGGVITTKTKRLGHVYVDLRFKSASSAIRWAGPKGYRVIKVFIIDE
jgi:3D (Asp-Asp-Asp) domain-containing protein